MEAVQQVFGNRVITHDMWPPRLPDLTPPDFYLWGELKGTVYANNPHTIEHLKDNIRPAISKIQREELVRVFTNMRKRVELCLEVNGRHFQQLMSTAIIMKLCKLS